MRENYRQIAEQTALYSAMECMKTMLAGQKAFGYIRGGTKHLNKLLGIKKYYDEEKLLLPWMISALTDELWEKWADGLGIMKNDPAIKGASVHHDLKKGIRY